MPTGMLHLPKEDEVGGGVLIKQRRHGYYKNRYETSNYQNAYFFQYPSNYNRINGHIEHQFTFLTYYL
jgi:hypothetical protein